MCYTGVRGQDFSKSLPDILRHPFGISANENLNYTSIEINQANILVFYNTFERWQRTWDGLPHCEFWVRNWATCWPWALRASCTYLCLCELSSFGCDSQTTSFVNVPSRKNDSISSLKTATSSFSLAKRLNSENNPLVNEVSCRIPTAKEQPALHFCAAFTIDCVVPENANWTSCLATD